VERRVASIVRFAAAAAAASALLAAGAGAVGVMEGTVHLAGTRHLPDAYGKAFIDRPGRDTEIAMRVHGLPRTRHPAYLAWLVPPKAHGVGYVGGAFPRAHRDDGFDGSLIVPG
jgi:hypothetical protein